MAYGFSHVSFPNTVLLISFHQAEALNTTVPASPHPPPSLPNAMPSRLLTLMLSHTGCSFPSVCVTFILVKNRAGTEQYCWHLKTHCRHVSVVCSPTDTLNAFVLFGPLLFVSIIKAVSFIKAGSQESEMECRVWRLCWLEM